MKQKINLVLSYFFLILNLLTSLALFIFNGLHTTKGLETSTFFVYLVAVFSIFILVISIKSLLRKNITIKEQFLKFILIIIFSFLFLSSLNCSSRCIPEDTLNINRLKREEGVGEKCVNVDVHYFYFIKIDKGKNYCFNSKEPAYQPIPYESLN